ncbi:MAG: SoxR reducing system RseC family protein [Spirochaetia bacterium]|nr:SoxR reducing system RseC family protein [Spirochaetia bacterium]MBQ3647699.1 SoxR reducing system RseC family protein [Spirochaetia bacterium]MBQ3713949.1 SoxR reducing system RseC family protein [Spirochaetia bacterium]MBQ6673508.1 SoxR reducing system RseC family protein [Spirochaetia bacterium]MBR0318057.1 SoxR reducing system RseC family protein [Spirochaetia bacterium]
MYECGVVQKISDRIVTIKCGTNSACAACKSPICNKKDRIFEVRNTQGFELAEGDEVEFLLPSGRTVFESFLVLILPLLLFIAFYYIGKGIFGAESEGKNIICGLIGIANGFLIALFYKRLRGSKDIPVITRKC